MENYDNQYITAYYGTQDMKLVRDIPLNPLKSKGKIFEFGNGVYFTNDKKIAMDYARGNIYYSIAEGKNRVTGNLHTFLISRKIFENEKLIIDNDQELKEELVNVLKGYRKNGLVEGYRPDRYLTCGEMIGKYWDNLVDIYQEDNPLYDICKITNTAICELVDNCINYKNREKLHVKQYCIYSGIRSDNDEDMRLDENYVILQSSESV